MVLEWLLNTAVLLKKKLFYTKITKKNYTTFLKNRSTTATRQDCILETMERIMFQKLWAANVFLLIFQ